MFFTRTGIRFTRKRYSAPFFASHFSVRPSFWRGRLAGQALRLAACSAAAAANLQFEVPPSMHAFTHGAPTAYLAPMQVYDRSRKRKRCILPVAVFGNAVVKTIERGYL